jgi:hypothetical protein
MRFFIFAAACMLMLIGSVYGQWLYAFDQSCQFHPNYVAYQQAFDEAVSMAGVARERIANPNDQITERLFRTIFKVPRAQELRPHSKLVHYYYFN